MDIKETSNGRVVDYMSRDYESLLAAMHDMIPQLPLGTQWTEFNEETDLGNILLQLFAHVGDIISYYQDRVVNESFLSTAVERKSIIEHLRLIGYKLATATPAAAQLNLRFPPDCEDTVVVNPGDAFATATTRESPSVRFEYTGTQLSIPCAELATTDTPDGAFKVFPITVEQGRLIREDVLGTSDGTINQRFDLSRSPLILRSLSAIGSRSRMDIELWLELGPERDNDWQLQDTLAFSREDAKDYTVEIDENNVATVIFGGEDFGAVPPVGAVVKARYRVGGGRQGNVAAGTITTITDAPALSAVAATVINPSAASGGEDRESIRHAVQHAPGVFRSLNRAVTAEDYKNLALNFNGVGKVIAQASSWNRVTLYVAPQGGGQVSDVLRENLLAFFEDKRPLSTLIEIKDVEYLKIYLEAEIGVEGYFSENQVVNRVQEAVRNVLAFDNNDFGETLYESKFYEAIEAIEGVRFVFISRFAREGRPGEPETVTITDGRLQLRANELPRIPGSFAEDPPAEKQQFSSGLKLTVRNEA